MSTRGRRQLGVAAAIAFLLLLSGALMTPTADPRDPIGIVSTPRSPNKRPPAGRLAPSQPRAPELLPPTRPSGPDDGWSTPLDVPDGLRTMGLPIFVDGSQMGTLEPGAPTPELVWEDTDVPEVSAGD